MTYGEAFDFCMAGGKVRATKTYSDGTTCVWVAWYDNGRGQWASHLQEPLRAPVYESTFIGCKQTADELDKWAFEDADPKPPFEVRAEVDDDMALCVSIFWRGGLVIGTDRDDAIQLYEALGAAIKCAQCGAYLDDGGDCHDPMHKGAI